MGVYTYKLYRNGPNVNREVQKPFSTTGILREHPLRKEMERAIVGEQFVVYVGPSLHSDALQPATTFPHLPGTTVFTAPWPAGNTSR